MKKSIPKEDAMELVKLVKAHADQLDKFLMDRKSHLGDDEFKILKNMVGNLMGFQYFEIIEPITKTYKDI